VSNKGTGPTYSLGPVELLQRDPIALFCSVKCPGELIVKTYELCLRWRREGKAVISGFHAPMERECLSILLKGVQPLIVAPARGIWKRLPPELKPALKRGNLLIVSPFPPNVRRITRKTSEARNAFIGTLVNRIFAAYAEPGGHLERLCWQWTEEDKHLFTFQSEYTRNLLNRGWQAI